MSALASKKISRVGLHKDRVLNELAETANVAQFVSFRPRDGRDLVQEFSRIRGHLRNHQFDNVRTAIEQLLEKSGEGSINIRSYSPDSPRSREFIYGIRDASEAMAALGRLSGEGLSLIANETIDIHDGGVSGVVQNDLVEFAPDDTPRCVEKPGVASLPKALASRFLNTIYGVDVSTLENYRGRLEFSVHPQPRGWKGTHVLVWEHEEECEQFAKPTWIWPNRYSRHVGDKAYGLLIAHLLNFSVPETLVIGRRIKPFNFGSPTGNCEVWIRTCPIEPDPGKYTTHKGWLDPFRLLREEDPKGDTIASVLSQQAVKAKHSGAAVVLADGSLVVEGRAGEGDAFMLGCALPEPLPKNVTQDVKIVFEGLTRVLGNVRFEWVHDGSKPWIVQLHCGATQSTPTVIVPGEALAWTEFKAEDGLEALRLLLKNLAEGHGLRIAGEFGLTSHLADLLRKAGRPARFAGRS